MFGLKYFGGLLGDLQNKLQQNHPNVPIYTASIGKLSSNWDRACELFAYIRGGTTDYGEAHSSYHQHARFGPTYPGIYPEWGTLDERGKLRKVHLIGHSMGGVTIRMLAYLLSNGAQENVPHPELSTDLNDLFIGNKSDWIHSITTISSPLQGSTSASMDNALLNFGLKGFTSFFGFPMLNDYVLDMKLEQFGLQRFKNESYIQYISRLRAHPIFQVGSKAHRDTGFYDLTLDGAKELNHYVKDVPSVFYISYSTSDTSKSTTSWRGESYSVHRPNYWMYPPYLPISFHIGGLNTLLHYNKTEYWQQNDGVLNTGSMGSPPNSISIEFDPSRSVFESGKWYQFPLLDGFDHISGIGWTFFGRDKVMRIYDDHVKFLATLTLTNEQPYHRKLEQQAKTNSTVVLQGIVDSIKQYKTEARKQRTLKGLQAFCQSTERSDDEKNYCQYYLTFEK